MSDTKENKTLSEILKDQTTQPWDKYNNHPEVTVLPPAYRFEKKYSLYCEELSGMARLGRAIKYEAANQMFGIFGRYDFSCPKDSPFLGGAIREDIDPSETKCQSVPKMRTTCMPWELTNTINHAKKIAMEKMSIDSETHNRTTTYKEALDTIVDEIEWEIVETVLFLHDKDEEWFCHRIEEFQTWLECFYYSYDDWSWDYQNVYDDFVGEIQLQDTEEYLKNSY